MRKAKGGDGARGVMWGDVGKLDTHTQTEIPRRHASRSVQNPDPRLALDFDI